MSILPDGDLSLDPHPARFSPETVLVLPFCTLFVMRLLNILNVEFFTMQSSQI